MIPFFVGYALLVWFFTARHRRTVRAFVWAGAGILTLLTIMYGHWRLGQWHPEFMIQGLQILLYPYTLLVGSVAVFIAAMPRRFDPGSCVRCGYDLASLDHWVRCCPECGRPSDVSPRWAYRKSGWERGDLRQSDVLPLPEGGPHAGAGDQDHAGDQAEQHPPQRGELAG